MRFPAPILYRRDLFHLHGKTSLMVPNLIDDEQGRRAGLVRLALATVRASEPVPVPDSVPARAPATAQGVEAQESDSASQFSSLAGIFPVAPLHCFLTVKTGTKSPIGSRFCRANRRKIILRLKSAGSDH